jgi:alpha-1,2-mannosyltransferase
VPLALVAGGRWRTVAAAFASAMALCLLSLWTFGWDTWRAFLMALAASPTVYVSGKISFAAFVTPFGAARFFHMAPSVAYAIQIAGTLAAAGFVAWVWCRDLPLPIRAASLAAATLVAVPLALFYDLVLAGVAGAWLLRAEGRHRLPEWSGWALAGLYVLSLNPRGMSNAWHLPLGSLIALGFAALVATAALRGAATPKRPALDHPLVLQPGAARS